ncbi:MAG: hypothetical protein DBX47_03945 [Clostridiales bacterium]|nr:MAG: hypothetical protein DBX47_03945 [Clostridiales bacterium]
MKKVLAFSLIAVMFFTIFTGCQNKEKNADVKKNLGDGTWTVFMCLCGTDLESEQGAATSNLNEILSVSMSENISFVIQTGGTKQWNTPQISSEKLQRFLVKDGKLILKDEQPSASMGDADTLSSFLSWGIQKFPADKYMSLFWNHGGGSSSGVEFDELYGNDSLSLVELADGISRTKTNFEVIGFDACLMATFENAQRISEFGKYMVASEEYEPGTGWDYTAWVDYLSKNPNCSGADLGKVICDTYYNKCKVFGYEDMATLSVIDLEKMPSVVSAFDQMAVRMTKISTDINSFQKLAKAALKAENYGGNTDNEGYTNMVDLIDLTDKAQGVLEGTDTALRDAVLEAVVYNICGTNRSNASGLSVFYPLTQEENMISSYMLICQSIPYLKFISTYVPDLQIPDWINGDQRVSDIVPVESENFAIEQSTQITEDAFYQLSVERGLESIAAVYFSLYNMSGEGNYIQLGIDDDINADWEKGVFKDNFRNMWPTINGSYCAPEIIAQEEGYNIYSIPVLLNGEKTNLRAVYDFNTEIYTVIGAYDGVSAYTGMSSRNIREIKPGDKITFLFNILSDNNSELFQGDTITVNEELAMVESTLLDGDYMYQYNIITVFGQTICTSPVIMSVVEGEIYLS